MLVYIWVASPTVFLCHQQKNTLFGDALILSVRRSALIPYIAAAMNVEIRSMIFYRSEPEALINVISFYREYFQKWLDTSYPNNIFDPSNTIVWNVLGCFHPKI